MVSQLWCGAICLLLRAAAGLAADPAVLVSGGVGRVESEPGGLRSAVLQKGFVLGSPAANSYTASTDVSFIITFVFNMVFLGAIVVAVTNAAQQAGEAASSRRRHRLDYVPLERRSSLVRHRRRHVAVAATLAPDIVHAIVEHVSDPAPADTAPAATAPAPAAPDASADFDDYAGYERYPSRYDDQTEAGETRFKPSSLTDILDYLYETDRSLYDQLQLRVARRSPPPQRGANEGDYAEYLASVYGYSGLKRDRDGYRDGYSALEGDRDGYRDGYSALEGDRDGYRDGYSALEGVRDDWQIDQETAQLSYRTAGEAGLSGKAPYEEDLLGAPLKFYQRQGESGSS